MADSDKAPFTPRFTVVDRDDLLTADHGALVQRLVELGGLRGIAWLQILRRDLVKAIDEIYPDDPRSLLNRHYRQGQERKRRIDQAVGEAIEQIALHLPKALQEAHRTQVEAFVNELDDTAYLSRRDVARLREHDELEASRERQQQNAEGERLRNTVAHERVMLSRQEAIAEDPESLLELEYQRRGSDSSLEMQRQLDATSIELARITAEQERLRDEREDRERDREREHELTREREAAQYERASKDLEARIAADLELLRQPHNTRQMVFAMIQELTRFQMTVTDKLGRTETEAEIDTLFANVIKLQNSLTKIPTIQDEEGNLDDHAMDQAYAMALEFGKELIRASQQRAKKDLAG